MFPHERSLVKKLDGKPFALLGVNSDRDRNYVKAQNQKQEITWRSFWNGPQGTGGPISRQYKVNSWPTIYVLDERGVIRYKNVRGEKMEEAVDALIKDMEGGG